MNTEQEKAAYQTWADLHPLAYPGIEHDAFIAGYRAALQHSCKETSQDREDEVEFQIGIEGEVQAQTFGPREQAWAEIQRYAAQYAEDGPIEIWEVTRRRIEGDGE